MTWNAFHNRGEILRAVIAEADKSQNGELPKQVPGVAENFADDLDLLSALLLKWHARLSGNVERELMAEPLDLETAVAHAWRRTADEMPGVLAIIDRHSKAPADARMDEALSRAREREWIRLAMAAGAASYPSKSAATAGHRIELEARSLNSVPEAPATVTNAEPPVESGSLVERIKAVLVA